MDRIHAQLIHDMRNSATAIAGAARVVRTRRGEMTDETIDALCDLVARRSDMLVRLLNDLRDLALLDEGHLDVVIEPVDIAALVADLVADRPDDVVSTSVDPGDDLVVRTDAIRVTQMIENLLLNAQRYGGDDVVVSARRTDCCVVVEVSDDGSGVPDDILENLFDEFTHGARSGELGGSGLGLAIVQRLADALHGAVNYVRDDRTRFVVTLPIDGDAEC